MPVQTRARAPANRVYSSPAAQQQAKFRQRKKSVASRHSLGASRPSRQQTLTQIDFVNPQQGIDDHNEDDIYDEGRTRKHKRRRTEGDAPTSTAKFHTQTLTQLEFVSTPAVRLEGLSDEENDFQILFDRKHMKSTNPVQSMGPPKTPGRQRVYEVPSSQSPITPSPRSRRSLPTRYPLKALDINRQAQVLSPVGRAVLQRSPKVKQEIGDAFETHENESQKTQIPRTPTNSSRLFKASGYTATRPPHPKIGTQKYIKTEIQDSDEENDDHNLGSYYNDPVPVQQSQIVQESQVSPINAPVKNPQPISSDTQEAEEQLHSTMLQFTTQQLLQLVPSTREEPELIPSTAEQTVSKSVTPPRPSQATTVSLSRNQTPTSYHLSSPSSSTQAIRRLPGPEISALLDSTDGERIVVTIPDSPARQLDPPADINLSSPILPRLPNLPRPYAGNAENEAEEGICINTILVPLSIPSSQLLTRSQMLPESLMNDSIPQHPPRFDFVEDSELEEEE